MLLVKWLVGLEFYVAVCYCLRSVPFANVYTGHSKAFFLEETKRKDTVHVPTYSNIGGDLLKLLGGNLLA